jgi:hypothetical protein
MQIKKNTGKIQERYKNTVGEISGVYSITYSAYFLSIDNYHDCGMEQKKSDEVWSGLWSDDFFIFHSLLYHQYL